MSLNDDFILIHFESKVVLMNLETGEEKQLSDINKDAGCKANKINRAIETESILSKNSNPLG